MQGKPQQPSVSPRRIKTSKTLTTTDNQMDSLSSDRQVTELINLFRVKQRCFQWTGQWIAHMLCSAFCYRVQTVKSMILYNLLNLYLQSEQLYKSNRNTR